MSRDRPGFWRELRRRKVVQVGVAYAAVGFVVWQVAEIAFPALDLGDAAVTFVVVATLLGFPLALVLAWAYELRPEEPAPELSRAGDASGKAMAAVDTRPDPARPALGSIAILPFENMSTEQGSEYFADGISEELTHALGRMPSLRVAARTSAFSFKGRHVDAREIGSQLNVAHVVEGSVRRAGSRLRVTAQLIDTSQGYHVWSDRFERELEDVFAIQDDIVEAVVESLMERLGIGTDRDTPTLARTENLGAYDLYLRGRHELRRYDGASIEEAVALFERATDVDPGFAPAFAALAEALTTQALGFAQGGTGDLLPRARDAAERALDLDPTLPEAHVAAALSLLYHDWAFKEARTELEEATRLNPSHVDAHRWAEFYWTYAEYDFEQASAALARARVLDPLDPRLVVREGVLGYLFGHYTHAEAIFRELLAAEEPPPIALIGLMETLHRSGRREEAASVARQLPVRDDTPNMLVSITGGVLATCGGEEEARQRLRLLESRGEPHDSLAFYRSGIHAGLGEMDEAFALLDEAFAQRDGGLLYLIVLPKVEGFQDDPRFAMLLRRMGLGHLVAAI